MVAFSEVTRKQVERILTTYCSERLAVYLHDEMRLSFGFRGNRVTLYEERAALAKSGMWVRIPVAQFRFNHETKQWTLHWPDRNSKWHEYEFIESSKKFETLLKEVRDDPKGIFWD